MPAGRPTKYRSEMCEQIIACGKLGMGSAEMAAELDVYPDTIPIWMEKHEEFSRAVLRAKALSLAWWNTQGRIGIWDQDETTEDDDGNKTRTRRRLNSQAYSLQVRNRFPDDWREKTEQVVKVKGDDVLDKLIVDANSKGKK